MKKKYFWLLFLNLTFSLSCFSQIIMKGKVTDSLQTPLPYANVIAQPLDSLKKMTFSVANEQGLYRLELEQIPYTVSISFMGYKTHSFNINPTENKEEIIVLKEQPNALDEVVIELPVTIRQDTITYKVDKFITGDERKLKNVLAKLPGVEVEKDGTVRVQGKKITTLLVENKKFFGGQTKLAIDNIPADVVYEVEVIENYSEIAFLKNLVDGNETAMNIKLKENKKNFVFGDFEAGKGNKKFYRGHGNLFYYSPKTNINAIGNLNNTAEQVFTYKQYFDFQGGASSLFNKGSTTFDLTNNDLLQFIERDDVVSSNRQFGAINITQEVSNTLNVSAYGIFSKTKENTLNQQVNQYNNAFTEHKALASQTNNVFGIGNLHINYVPNLKSQWLFKTQVKRTNNHYNNTIDSEIAESHNTFMERRTVESSFFNQNIEWHRRQSKAHTFSFAANYTFNETRPNTQWSTTDDILYGLVPIVEDSLYIINQSKSTKTNDFDILFKHYWVINRFNHIYTTVRNTFLNHSFHTKDSQKLSNGMTNDFAPSDFGNLLDFRLNDFYLGINYKFKTGKFAFDQGAFLHHYHWKLDQNSASQNSKWVLLPNSSTELDFSQTQKLKLDYELNASFPGAAHFANRYYLNAYNSVYKGNDNLENELFHSLNLRYNRFSTYKGLRFYANVRFIQKVKGFENAINYEGINQYIMPILLNNAQSTWNIYGKIQKKIKRIDYSLGVNSGYSEYLQQLNDLLNTNYTSNVSYDLSMKTLFDDFPTIEVGFRQSFGHYNLNRNRSRFITSEPFINFDYDFLKGFITSFDYAAFFYKNKTSKQSSTYDLANASIYYKNENSAWSYKLEVNNLFDAQYKSHNNLSSYIVSDSRTYIFSRTIMFSIGYNL